MYLHLLPGCRERGRCVHKKRSTPRNEVHNVILIFVSNCCISVQVVTREAIYYGLADSSFKASLVGWALPYAQRYFWNLHPDKYIKLKRSGFDILNGLQVIVVEKLYYRNVIKSSSCASKKRIECSCLLQVSDEILYCCLLSLSPPKQPLLPSNEHPRVFCMAWN